MEAEKGRIKVRDINEYLTCSLCNGYLIDATTIVECLHSFCRTCIVHYLHTSNYCPRCECVVHKKFPHQNIRSDRLLQDIVYKIVPGLFKEELRRRQEYFIKNNHPKDDWEEVSRQSRRRFFSQDDKISLCLEFSPRKTQGEVVNRRDSLKGDNRRYLLCPAKLTVRLLKKFLQNKFSLDSNMEIDMWCASEPLADEYTLIDVAYVVRWKRKRPMRIHYRIYEARSKKPRKETVSAFANSPANDSGIEDESPSFELSSEDPIIFADPDDVNWNEYEREARAVETADCEETKENIDDEKDCQPSVIEIGQTKQHCQPSLIEIGKTKQHCQPSVVEIGQTKQDCQSSVIEIGKTIQHCSKENEHLTDKVTEIAETVDILEQDNQTCKSSKIEENVEGASIDEDIEETVKDSCLLSSNTKADCNLEKESEVPCLDKGAEKANTIPHDLKYDQQDILIKSTEEEGHGDSSEIDKSNNDVMNDVNVDQSENALTDSSPGMSPLVIDMQVEQMNDEVSVTEKGVSADESEQKVDDKATESNTDVAKEEKGNSTVDKSEQTELEDEEEADSGPSFNDSGAQTSPYYEEDPEVEESEEIWNEGAIDLSKPKMIVIEPLPESIMENRDILAKNRKETSTDHETNLLVNTHYAEYCENVLNVKIEESPRHEDDNLEDVTEYNYVADGIEEVEATRAFHNEEFPRPKHDLNEHSYSMMPNLEPRDRHSNIILKQSTGKAMITIPGSFPVTSVNRAISPITSITKPSMCSEIIVPSPSKLMTTFKSPRQAAVTKRKRKHESKGNNTKVEKTVCKKSRKCTNVCNGHSVPQRSEKLVVKLSKSRNSNSYTATMT